MTATAVYSGFFLIFLLVETKDLIILIIKFFIFTLTKLRITVLSLFFKLKIVE